ncbi:MAG: hypothetical protein K2J38_00545 [Muribaculaceae bacterium]|nr:hypothetical protein [Muribaculaceae bacterium]
MNRFFTFSAAALLCFTATQAAPMAIKAKLPGVPVETVPIYNPEGAETDYIMDVVENDYWGTSQQIGYKMQIRRSEDGSKIYFRDLAPGFGRTDSNEEYTWIEGDVDGSVITLRAGQAIYKNDIQLLNLEFVTLDENGAVDRFLESTTMAIDAEGAITVTDPDVYFMVYKDGETMEEAGAFLFLTDYQIRPVGDIVSITPPAGAVIEQYILLLPAGQRQLQVAVDGQDVYVAGFSTLAPEDWVKGTLADDVLTFGSGVILTSNPLRYLRLFGAVQNGTDEWGSPLVDMSMSFSFAFDSAKRMFTLAENYWVLEVDYNISSFYNGFTDACFMYYEGDRPAVPATPSVIDVYEIDDMAYINVPAADVDGNYINPELLSYRIYIDGILHEFTPDAYFGLSESMTELPYYFTDNYDIYCNGDIHTVFFHVDSWQTIEVESVYTVDGVTNVSEKAYYASADAPGIIRQPVSTTYTDLLGRRLDAPTPGSLVIRTTTWSDGTVSTGKTVVK